MYGGRVIDDFDRRVVNIYMDEYMGDFIFDTFQPFHFYKNEEVRDLCAYNGYPYQFICGLLLYSNEVRSKN